MTVAYTRSHMPCCWGLSGNPTRQAVGHTLVSSAARYDSARMIMFVQIERLQTCGRGASAGASGSEEQH